MSWFHAFLLGAIEGLTEFLPISSTGHLILLDSRLGNSGDATKTLEIVIQLGAVLAVIVYYRARIGALLRGVARRDPASLRLATAVAIAFVPAAVVGLAIGKKVKKLLFGPVPVAQALIVGGVVMVGIEIWRRYRGQQASEGLEEVTPRRALLIGLAQCFSLWPGTSRSMTTIIGGQLTGLGTATAADFSFFLAIPTLGAATLYELVKGGREILEIPGGASALVIGLVVSFVVALLVISAFLRYLKRFGLMPFGVYRIALGALVLFLASGAAPPAAEASHDAAPAASSGANVPAAVR